MAILAINKGKLAGLRVVIHVLKFIFFKLSHTFKSCFAFCSNSLLLLSWHDHVPNQQLHNETTIGAVTCIIQNHSFWLYGNLARFPEDEPAYQFALSRENHRWRRPMGQTRKLWNWTEWSDLSPIAGEGPS